jgi:hypothetical protein
LEKLEAMALRVEYLPLDGLTPAKRNPKRHGIAGVRASIGRFGYVEPMVRDDRTGRLVAGHGRMESLRAMQAAGEAPPAGVREEDGRWMVPVLCGWASKSDADAEAYLVASNRHVEVGGWDDRELAELLTGLRSADALDAAVGYTSEDLDKLLEGLAADLAGPPDLDTSPKLGDAFEHKILVECADERQQAELLEEFEGRGLKCRALAL